MTLCLRIIAWTFAGGFGLGLGTILGSTIAMVIEETAINAWDRLTKGTTMQPQYGKLKTKGIDWRAVRRRVHTFLGYAFPALAVIAPPLVNAIMDHKTELPASMTGLVTVLAIGQTAVHYYRQQSK